ncbi:HlyD family secretion protein [Phenylobacterium sp.]|uniref:HlyD family secretion protein n=1 Tax=Phenylobacterium sp. TaxID=1871053 RepID=UPI0025CCE8D4|nr:HlyD family secretion protein [Phenylobacterium sp.]MBX3486036.1 HlyD family secretion protein [Phenylobacterium sp.]
MTEIDAAPRPAWRPSQQRPLVVVAAVAAGVVAVVAVLSVWGLTPFGRGSETTDNAYVRGRTTVIAPQVSGYVTYVAVKDYQAVSAGEVLADVDDRGYQARLAQARAAVAAAEAALANSQQARASRSAGLEGQTAALASARAQLARARADMARVDDLVRDGSVSVREQDQTRAALRQAEAQVRQALAGNEIARQDVRTVDVGRGGLEANVQSARAALAAAEVDLEHTVIRAPEAGQLGEVGVRLGQYVTNGVQLMSLIPRDRWVIANFKEAQTARMAVGQSVTFTVDALGGAKLHGYVERISPAAGSEFAVLKPDNATGNFVKVPQRIGVRIAIDPDQPMAARLRPGMSVTARVDTRSHR